MNWAESDEKVRKIFSEKLQIDKTKIEAERTDLSEIPVTNLGDRPRPIVVKFLRFKNKTTVLQRAKNFRGTNMFLN